METGSGVLRRIRPGPPLCRPVGSRSTARRRSRSTRRLLVVPRSVATPWRLTAAAVGIAAVLVALRLDPRWLLFLLPLFWLLYQAHRQRAVRERRIWLAYAQAVKALNRLDEVAVAVAGVAGALRIFGAERVELDVIGTRGQRSYRGDSSGIVDQREASGPPRPEPAVRAMTRALVVGDDRVGELRVWPPQRVPADSSDDAICSAYADALAAALHDAVASRERAVLAARSADAASVERLTLLTELREALTVEDQLVLALQPAVELTTGAPTGVEALVRWRHPRRGKLNPADFIRVVEDSDLLAPFTRYVVDKALAVAADWSRHGLAVPISVNLSARSLLDPRLPGEVAALLRRYQVPAKRLVLEITETAEMSELQVIDEVLGGLRALGVQLAVDDFGTGFSSLAFLTRVPVNELKVDRSFVLGMADSPEAAAIVRATIALGHELGLRVIAEGVETAEQRAALAALGCAAAQGYHFFKPMSPERVLPVLRSLSAAAHSLPR